MTSSKQTGFSFRVDDVEQATAPLSPINDWKKLIAGRCGVPKLESSFSKLKPMSDWTVSVEDMEEEDQTRSSRRSTQHTTNITRSYSLMLCVNKNVVIAQGFARHVNENAEKLRNLFVEHEGKKTLHCQAK